MKIILNVKPNEDARSDWRLEVLNKLNVFLETLQIDDFSITIAEIEPCIVSLIEPKAKPEEATA